MSRSRTAHGPLTGRRSKAPKNIRAELFGGKSQCSFRYNGSHFTETYAFDFYIKDTPRPQKRNHRESKPMWIYTFGREKAAS